MEASSLARKRAVISSSAWAGNSMDSAQEHRCDGGQSRNLLDYIQGRFGKGASFPLQTSSTSSASPLRREPERRRIRGPSSRRDTQERSVFRFQSTFPTMSIVDPELMLSVPPKLTAYQGFDALFHAVEGYMATIASPMGDMFALQAIEYIASIFRAP